MSDASEMQKILNVLSESSAAMVQELIDENVKLKEDLSSSEANAATLQSEDTDAMKQRDELFTANHINERTIKAFIEAALPPQEVSTTSAERAVEIVANMKATYVPQRNAIEMMERLEAVGYGKPGTPNTLFCMVLAACDDAAALRDLLRRSYLNGCKQEYLQDDSIDAEVYEALGVADEPMPMTALMVLDTRIAAERATSKEDLLP